MAERADLARQPRPGAAATIRAATALLTRLPVALPAEEATGAAAFALIGAVVGLIGGVTALVLGTAQPALAGIVAIAVIAICSGGLHLDGLADTADALVARDLVAAERARKDPAVGPTGAAALIFVIGAQAAALAGIASRPDGPLLALGACVAAVTVSRLVPVVAARVARRRALTDGFGAWFIQRVTTADVVMSTVSTALVLAGIASVVAVAGSMAGAVAVLVGAAAGGLGGGLALAALVAARGHLEGDGLGAGIEFTMTATLAAIALLA